MKTEFASRNFSFGEQSEISCLPRFARNVRGRTRQCHSFALKSRQTAPCGARRSDVSTRTHVTEAWTNEFSDNAERCRTNENGLSIICNANQVEKVKFTVQSFLVEFWNKWKSLNIATRWLGELSGGTEITWLVFSVCSIALLSGSTWRRWPRKSRRKRC